MNGDGNSGVVNPETRRTQVPIQRTDPSRFRASLTRMIRISLAGSRRSKCVAIYSMITSPSAERIVV